MVVLVIKGDFTYYKIVLFSKAYLTDDHDWSVEQDLPN